jgi:hypothetical protein
MPRLQPRPSHGTLDRLPIAVPRSYERLGTRTKERL